VWHNYDTRLDWSECAVHAIHGVFLRCICSLKILVSVPLRSSEHSLRAWKCLASFLWLFLLLLFWANDTTTLGIIIGTSWLPLDLCQQSGLLRCWNTERAVLHFSLECPSDLDVVVDRMRNTPKQAKIYYTNIKTYHSHSYITMPSQEIRLIFFPCLNTSLIFSCPC